MVLDISIFCALCFILVQVLLLTVVQSAFLAPLGNETDHTPPWTSGRSKRSLSDRLPRYLKIRIKYTTGEEMDLEWSMIDQHLANEHLPVITPFADINLNVMANIGEFVMYHDPQRCSAVVYFEKLKVLYGVIGMNYYIVSLPFDFNIYGEHNMGIVGEPYIRKHQDSPIHIHPNNVLPSLSDTAAWGNFIPLFNSESDRNRKRKTECDADSIEKHRRTEQHHDGRTNVQEADTSQRSAAVMRHSISKYQNYYLETLIFVAHDIAELFKVYFGRDHYVEWIVRYYIVYFNAVDMMYQKSETSAERISINIAKIVIEDDFLPLDFIVRGGELEFAEIVAKLPRYLDAYPASYSPDSFDHVFIQTSRTIMDDVIPVNGMTKYGTDLYDARKKNKFSDAVPITIVKYQYDFADYGRTVHEMGKIFNMEIEQPERGLNNMGQCYSIMQIKGPKCDNCLKWSEDSLRLMKTFLSTNRNRCFLLNEPRSLKPHVVRRLLSAHQQCRCFGYHYYISRSSGFRKNTVGVDQCGQAMQCAGTDDQESLVENSVRPFDGTPCTTNKVCWDGKCTKVSSI